MFGPRLGLVQGTRDTQKRAEPGAAAAHGGVEVMARAELQSCPEWRSAFASQHKDCRYY